MIRIINGLHYVSCVMIFSLMILGASDVIGRYFLSHPIRGAREISSILTVGIVTLSWAYVFYNDAHIKIEFVIAKLKPPWKELVKCGSMCLSLLVFVLIGWQSIDLALRYWKVGYLVPVIELPLAPFQLLVTAGASVVCLQHIYNIVRLPYFLDELKKQSK